MAAPIFGIGFARLYENEMLRAVESDMIHQAQLLREVIALDPQGPNLRGRQRVLERAARHTVTRIRLVDAEGNVAADSHRTGSEPEVRERREVRRALDGRYGAATRAGDDHAFLFSAVPIVRGERVVGVIYVSRSTTAVHAAMHRLRSSLYRVLFWSLIATVVLSFLFAATASKQHSADGPLLGLLALVVKSLGGLNLFLILPFLIFRRWRVLGGRDARGPNQQRRAQHCNPVRFGHHARKLQPLSLPVNRGARGPGARSRGPGRSRWATQPGGWRTSGWERPPARPRDIRS